MDQQLFNKYRVLLDILRRRRPADSFGELSLIKQYIIPSGANRDEFGNWYLRVGTAPVMWSCHTDTVHREPEKHKNDYFQQLVVTEDGILSVKNSSCLGADNGVGVYLMLKMLEAGVEGLYVFHRKEESGGEGSRWIAKNKPELVKDIQIAIAFDRRNTGSVITHQGYRTCSDEFADSLIAQLGLDHKKDDGGTFTDTKSYAELIPECTNVSAGFDSEHTYQESLDLHYVGRLLDALLKIDLSKLVVKRDPAMPPEYPSYYGRYGWGQGYYGSNRWYTDESDYANDDEYTDTDAYFLRVSTKKNTLRFNPDIVYEVLSEWNILDEVVAEVRARQRFSD